MSHIIHGLRRMIRDLENGMTAEELLIILNTEVAQKENWATEKENMK